MLKTLLILPKKWKTLEKRISNLEIYLSRKDRLGAIYGGVKIEYVIDPSITFIKSKQGFMTEFQIKQITNKYSKDYNAVGVIFAMVEDQPYWGNYYPDTSSSDHKLDFYILTDENTMMNRASGKFKNFERSVEHELSHAVAIDIGLKQQNQATGYLEGSDNTHYYFYHKDDLLDVWYKELNDAWTKKASVISKLISGYQTIIDSLKKKPITDLQPRVKRDLIVIGDRCAKKGVPFRLVEGYRSPERQTELFNQRPKVTNAKAGESLHQYGVALDIYPTLKGYNTPLSEWRMIAFEFKKLGYEWGGDWKRFTDKPHFELTLGHSIKDFVDNSVDYKQYR